MKLFLYTIFLIIIITCFSATTINSMDFSNLLDLNSEPLNTTSEEPEYISTWGSYAYEVTQTTSEDECISTGFSSTCSSLSSSVGFDSENDSCTHNYLLLIQKILDHIAAKNFNSDQTYSLLNESLLKLCAHVDLIELNELKKAAQKLIDAGARVNAFVDTIPHLNFAYGLSPFYVAILTGSCELVELLIQRGGMPSLANRKKYTSLMATLRMRYRNDGQILPMVKLLISHGAQINAASTRGDTALGYACAFGLQQTIFYLLEHGASIGKLNEKNGNILKAYIPDKFERISLVGTSNLLYTLTNIPEQLSSSRALVYAAAQGHANLVEIFLECMRLNQELYTEMYLKYTQQALKRVNAIVSTQVQYLSPIERQSYTTIIELLSDFLRPNVLQAELIASRFREFNAASLTNYLPASPSF